MMAHTNLNAWKPTREALFLEIIKENKLQLDNYSFVCDTMSPKGGLLITHVPKDGDIETIIENLAEKINGIRIDSLIITKYVLGIINNRLSDKIQSRQYELLISDYNYTPEKLNSIMLEPTSK